MPVRASEEEEALAALLSDPTIDPSSVSARGWALLASKLGLGGDLAPERAAPLLETSNLAKSLLRETFVPSLEAELYLRRLRRWLLIEDQWQAFPALTEALIAQAAQNGGAWPLEPDEDRRLERDAACPFRPAYLPRSPSPKGVKRHRDATTEAVAEQYRGWPYPAWSRITAPKPTTVPAALASYDPEGLADLPIASKILVAGCGTGREAAYMAAQFPDAEVTGIDISDSSLAYASARCSAQVNFHLLDLHQVDELGTRFDFIVCSGVLHHLPDPEAGWQALKRVLQPRGMMKVMVYSRLGRLRVNAAKSLINDLLDLPVTDNLLREARARIGARAPHLIPYFGADFFTLGGVHDLLFHRHEDLFDLDRIARDLEQLELELVAFDLPDQRSRSQYRIDFPDDRWVRDLPSLKLAEKRNPFLFQRMYQFYCTPAPS